MMENSCAVILAAGDGKRMKSNVPKAMCQVLFKPMISWVADWCVQAGISNVCTVTGRGGEQIQAVLPEGFVTVEQKERKGTGHAVMMAREFLESHRGKDVVVLCADAPFVDSEVIAASYQAHRQSGAAVTVVTACLEEPAGYGRILREQEEVKAIVEQKDGSPEQLKVKEINSGSYWFQVDFLLEALGKLDCTNAQQEYYLTDTVRIAVEEGRRVSACQWPDSSVVLGANDRKGLLYLNQVAREKVLDRLMEKGVNFYCTDGVVISPDAVIGPDTTIGPHTLLKGRVTIGSGCILEGGCIVQDSVLGDGCQIISSVIEESAVGSCVRVGPNAHLRPGTMLKDGVKIGNFVEVKNSVIGEKTSLAHLTYVGDSQVGCHVNMGCGCAVANYDGVHKHKAVIEDFAFLGCNTSLVSPVRIGRGAYTGAGSVITEDVPENALAVARSRQKNLEGWAEKWRRENGWQEYFDKKNPKK